MNPFINFDEDFLDMKSLLFLAGASGGQSVEYTAEGNPLSFTTNLVKPLKSLSIPWTPSQSGSGDPSPTNVRPISGVSAVNVWQTGKNLLDKANVINGYLSSSKLIGTTSARTVWMPCKPNTTYTCHKMEGGNRFTVKGFSEVPVVNAPVQYVTEKSGATNSCRVVTTGNDTYYLGMFVWLDTADPEISAQDMVDSVMVELGDVTPSAYTPYTGQSYPVTFPALGKNLLDRHALATAPAGRTSDGFVFKHKLDLQLTPNTYYTLSSSSTGAMNVLYFNGSNSSKVGVNKDNPRTQYSGSTGILSILLYDRENIADYENELIDLQLEVGETATPYEPYTNTVYGGSLDVTTGVLTATHLMWIKNTSEMNRTTPDYPGWNNCGIKNVVGEGLNKTIYATDGNLINIGDRVAVNTTGLNDNVLLSKSVYGLTQEEWQAMAIDVQFLYKLSDPVVVATLSPTQITALLGDNTIWSDTNGSNTAVYYKKG